jgi:hypothetical protein
LPTGEQESLRLELMAGQVGLVDLQPNAHGPSLVLAEARASQPGVDVGDAGVMGFVSGAAVAVALPGVTGPARVWNATGAASFEVDLRQVSLQQAAGQTLAFGISDGAVKARGALPVKLPGGASRVRLTLSPMNAAVFVRHGIVVSTHWAGDEALQETVTADADRLWLLNAGPSDARYSVELLPGGSEAEVALKPGQLLERNVSTAGRLRVAVEVPKTEGSEYRLRVRGNTEAIWQENGGRIESGSDIAVRASGVLWLQHQPGTLVAWLDEPHAEGLGRIGRWLESLQETAVRPPQSVALKGKQQVLSFNLDKAAMLHLRTDVPVVTQFLVQGRPAQTEAHLHGANINLPAPAGASRLLLRAVGADSLSGAATVMTTPVVQLADGAGPEVLLAPGSARLFAIDVKQAATIGIGVRASADVVRSVLYDEHGSVQSEGVVQLPTLAPGRYYLTVEMPTDSAPVRVQPIVLGLRQPDPRPPYDILRRYVEAGEGSEALIYVPPPPEPPQGADVQQEEASPDEGTGEEPDSESGEVPAEEEQQ